MLRLVVCLGLVAALPGRGWSAPRHHRGFLTIKTSVRTRVWIDGQDTGRETPARLLGLAPGRHRVELVDADSSSTVCDRFQVRIVRRRLLTIVKAVHCPRRSNSAVALAAVDPGRRPARIAAATTGELEPAPEDETEVEADAEVDASEGEPAALTARPDPDADDAAAQSHNLYFARASLLELVSTQSAAVVEGYGQAARTFGEIAVGADARYRYALTTPSHTLDLRVRLSYALQPGCNLAARVGYTSVVTASSGSTATLQEASGVVGGLQLTANELWNRMHVLANFDGMHPSGSSGLIYTLLSQFAVRAVGPLHGLLTYTLSYDGSAQAPIRQVVGFGIELRTGN